MKPILPDHLIILNHSSNIAAFLKAFFVSLMYNCKFCNILCTVSVNNVIWLNVCNVHKVARVDKVISFGGANTLIEF